MKDGQLAKTITNSDDVVPTKNKVDVVELGDMADTSCSSNQNFCDLEFSEVPSETSETEVIYSVFGEDKTTVVTTTSDKTSKTACSWI